MITSHLRSTGIRVASALAVLGMLAIPATVAGAQATHHGITYGGNVTAVAGPSASWTQNFNPITGGNNSNYGTIGLIYEPLVYFNGLSGKTTNWLASSYKWSKNLKTLSFTIRKGVKWSDGVAFGPADVYYSAELAVHNAVADPGMDPFLVSKNPVTVKGDVVSFHFKTVNTTMLYYIGFNMYIVPKHIFSTYSNPTTNTNFPPVGTGPFEMLAKNFSPLSYKLTKNPNYWQKGKPYIDSITYPAYSSNADVETDLIAGKIQWGGSFVPNAQSVLVDHGAKGNFYWYDAANNPMCLFLNNTKQPFSNVYVRRAISAALNREVIYKQGEYGYETPSNAGFVQTQFLKKWGVPKIVKSIPATGNKKLAKADLALAKKNPATAAALKKTYNIDVETGWSDWDNSAALMVSQLAAVGIHARVNQLNFSNPMPTATLATGNFDMGLNWTSSGVPSPYPIFHDWMWSYYKEPVNKTAIGNWERYKNPKLDRLIAAYAATATQSKQIAIMKKMEAIAAADVPIVPVVNQALWYEGNDSTITGFPTKQHPYDLGPAFENRWMEDVALHLHLK